MWHPVLLNTSVTDSSELAALTLTFSDWLEKWGSGNLLYLIQQQTNLCAKECVIFWDPKLSGPFYIMSTFTFDTFVLVKNCILEQSIFK